MLGVFSGEARWIGKYVFLSVWSMVLYPIGLLRAQFLAIPYAAGGSKNKCDLCLFSMFYL